MTTSQPQLIDPERKAYLLTAIRRGKWLWIPDSLTDKGLSHFEDTLRHLSDLESDGLIRVTCQGLGKHSGKQVVMRVEVQPVMPRPFIAA